MSILLYVRLYWSNTKILLVIVQLNSKILKIFWRAAEMALVSSENINPFAKYIKYNHT